VGEADKTDDRLTAERGDQIVVSFLDERHINGTSPRQVTRAITVVGEIDASPRVTQNVVPDVVLKAKKNIVEATAYLELARIFRSMGLLDDAAEKAREGLDRVDEIVMTPAAVPDDQRQEAFRLRWELYLVQDDFAQAVATCRLFNQLYPDSPFVDQALLGIARTKLEQDEFGGARAIYEQILKLENSQVKAQAQYQLALTVELEAEARAKAEAARRGQDAPKNVISESAIKAYRQCAQKYPDSEYAGLALAKVIDYYIANKDYIRAEDLLNQVFQDYPDAEFLDAMLARWVKVAINMGNLQKAYDKASDLLFQYPQSKYAAQAKELLPKLQAALNQ
jgi:outer membrane protein assembly factor BamD (BamD/ComL family)